MPKVLKHKFFTLPIIVFISLIKQTFHSHINGVETITELSLDKKIIMNPLLHLEMTGQPPPRQNLHLDLTVVLKMVIRQEITSQASYLLVKL
jgi:hypothetical protein